MSNSIRRVSQTSRGLDFQAPEAQPAQESQTPGSSFLKLVSSRLGEIRPPKSIQRRATVLHRSARLQVFNNIVTSVINEKHPVYSLVPAEIRQDMITAITEELVNSHYLT